MIVSKVAGELVRHLRRLRHSYDNYGLRALNPPAPPPCGPAYAPDRPHPFDVAHHVDTSGHIPGEALSDGTLADFYNTAYYAISPSTLVQALAATQINPGTFTFIDVGCGKGRALLVAVDLGFNQVLGVEIAGDLAQIARTNTTAYPCVQVHTQDATTFIYPPLPTLIFLYHPFLSPVLRPMLKNLLAQWTLHHYPLYLLFASPSYDRILNRLPELTHLWTHCFHLSDEDAAADRHGITRERYSLYQAL